MDDGGEGGGGAEETVKAVAAPRVKKKLAFFQHIQPPLLRRNLYSIFTNTENLLKR